MYQLPETFQPKFLLFVATSWHQNTSTRNSLTQSTFLKTLLRPLPQANQGYPLEQPNQMFSILIKNGVIVMDMLMEITRSLNLFLRLRSFEAMIQSRSWEV
jgi:hypothetical protein